MKQSQGLETTANPITLESSFSMNPRLCIQHGHFADSNDVFGGQRDERNHTMVLAHLRASLCHPRDVDAPKAVRYERRPPQPMSVHYALDTLHQLGLREWLVSPQEVEANGC